MLGLPNLVLSGVRLAAGLLCAYYLAKRLPAKQAVHGIVIGFAAEMLTTLVQIVFFNTYSSNNPSMATTFANLPEGADPRQYLLSYAPVIGLMQGIALGVFTWTACNVVKAKALASESQTAAEPAHPSLPRINGHSKAPKGKSE